MGFVQGGHIVAKAIAAEGISHVFTLCGGHVQMIYDGCIDHGIKVIDVRHEQSAGHAADGWAKVTGKPGVAIVTAGPGVTDVVTAAANAQRAQVPMVIIGGQGARAILEGWTEKGGKLPINPSGGLKSKGHPIGATGVSMHALAAMQLTGTAEGMQIPGAKMAGIFNMGGAAVANYVSILEPIR